MKVVMNLVYSMFTDHKLLRTKSVIAYTC